MKRKHKKRKRLNPSQRRQNQRKRKERETLAKSLENDAAKLVAQSKDEQQARLDKLTKRYGSLQLVPSEHYATTTERRVGKATTRQRVRKSLHVSKVVGDSFVTKTMKRKGFKLSGFEAIDSALNAQERKTIRNVENPFSVFMGEVIAVLSEEEGMLYGLDDFGFIFEVIETEDGVCGQWLVRHEDYDRQSVYNAIFPYCDVLADCLPANIVKPYQLPDSLSELVTTTPPKPNKTKLHNNLSHFIKD